MDTVDDCLRAGADGITATDSIGPALATDIETPQPRLEGPWGFAWLSGAAIKPIAVRVVAEIALRWDVSILGVGGISKAEDIVEMTMAGATAVQAHTAPLLAGIGWIGKTLKRLNEWLDAHGIASVAEVQRAALPSLRPAEDARPLDFAFDPRACTECYRCVTVYAKGPCAWMPSAWRATAPSAARVARAHRSAAAERCASEAGWERRGLTPARIAARECGTPAARAPNAGAAISPVAADAPRAHRTLSNAHQPMYNMFR